MCLRKKYKYPRFTIFPKTVYKRIRRERDNKFYTPFVFDYVEFGKTYVGRFCYCKNIIKTSIHDKRLDVGFIHCYKNYKSAFKDMCYREVIVKCKIPSFTFYFIGYNGQIAARKLKYIEIIKK